MRGIFAKISQFIKSIQRSNDATKRRWLTIFSGAGMLLVIVLWVTYLNATLPRTGAVPDATSAFPAVPPAPAENNPSFFKTLGLGWETISQNIGSGADSLEKSIGDGWNKFMEQIGRTNDLNLENPASTPAGN